jgi:hypothetical protein
VARHGDPCLARAAIASEQRHEQFLSKIGPMISGSTGVLQTIQDLQYEFTEAQIPRDLDDVMA